MTNDFAALAFSNHYWKRPLPTYVLDSGWMKNYKLRLSQFTFTFTWQWITATEVKQLYQAFSDESLLFVWTTCVIFLFLRCTFVGKPFSFLDKEMEEMGGRDRVMGALVITLQINLSCSKPDLARQIFSFSPPFQCSRFFFCQKDICGRASGVNSALD